MPSVKTVESWGKKHSWLKYITKSGDVELVYCTVCRNHLEAIKYCRNFSTKFVDGITGAAVKKDGVEKHAGSEAHKKAVRLDKRPSSSLDSLYKTTPIGRAFTHASNEEKNRVS